MSIVWQWILVGCFLIGLYLYLKSRRFNINKIPTTNSKDPLYLDWILSFPDEPVDAVEFWNRTYKDEFTYKPGTPNSWNAYDIYKSKLWNCKCSCVVWKTLFPHLKIERIEQGRIDHVLLRDGETVISFNGTLGEVFSDMKEYGKHYVV